MMDIVHGFDQFGLATLNVFAGRDAAVDNFIALVAGSPLAKVGAFGAFFWWAWFSGGEQRQHHRAVVIRTIAGGLLAALTSRLAQNFMPHRPRPLHNEAIDFTAPFGLNTGTLQEWSSFPSDNAALVFALATGVWVLSRPWGVLAYLWALIVVCLPRVYLGLHYPSDIVAGALLGLLCAIVALRMPLAVGICRTVFRFEARHTALFYGFAFLLTYQIVTLFDDVRKLGGGFLNVVKGLTSVV